MAIIPPVWAGNIQENDAAPKKQVSEYIAQKYGADNNFLKKTADDIQAQLDAFLASGPLSITNIFAGAHTTSVGSPNGKPWFVVFIEQEFGGIAQNDGPKPVLFTQPTWWPNGFSASIAGSVLLLGDFGHEWSGFGFYES